MTLTEVSFINVCHPSITHMYINPPLLSIEATSIQMSKRDPSHIHSCRCINTLHVDTERRMCQYDSTP